MIEISIIEGKEVIDNMKKHNESLDKEIIKNKIRCEEIENSIAKSIKEGCKMIRSMETEEEEEELKKILEEKKILGEKELKKILVEEALEEEALVEEALEEEALEEEALEEEALEEEELLEEELLEEALEEEEEEITEEELKKNTELLSHLRSYVNERFNSRNRGSPAQLDVIRGAITICYRLRDCGVLEDIK
jgi:hypothetical protein